MAEPLGHSLRIEALDGRHARDSFTSGVDALDRYLDVMDKVLPNLNKYVLAVDPDKVELRVNWERKDEIDLSPPPPPSSGSGGK